MNKFVMGFLFCLATLPLSAQSEEAFVFLPGTDVIITEKQDLRKRVNDRYEGFVYREMRCYLRETESGENESSYSGNVYVLEETKRNNILLARRLEESYPLNLSFRRDGSYVMDKDPAYPALRGVPSFPQKALAVGDRWRAFGERVIFSEESSPPTRVKIFCEYTYQGVQGSGDEAFFLFAGQYAVRYRGDDPTGDPRLSLADGSHKLEIRIPVSREGNIFMRDTVEEQYLLKDSTRIAYSGIILTWFTAPYGTNREGIREKLASILDSSKEGMSNAGQIELSENSEGLLLTLPDLHFVPDKTEILPDERNRLDIIASMLKDIPDVTFLVRGHTADVGSPESQQLLSEQRAAEVIRELAGRGLPAGRFLYEGKGGTVPLGDNSTDEGRKRNRRVEILILY